MKKDIPLLKSWKQWYALVLALLIILIFVFMWLTKYFS